MVAFHSWSLAHFHQAFFVDRYGVDLVSRCNIIRRLDMADHNGLFNLDYGNPSGGIHPVLVGIRRNNMITLNMFLLAISIGVVLMAVLAVSIDKINGKLDDQEWEIEKLNERIEELESEVLML